LEGFPFQCFERLRQRFAGPSHSDLDPGARQASQDGLVRPIHDAEVDQPLGIGVQSQVLAEKIFPVDVDLAVNEVR
jgi:hypothetical protein